MENQNILVISDTHGELAALEAVFRWAQSQEIHTTLFLGDGADDLGPASAAAGFACKWIIVRGNGDMTPGIPEADVFDFGSSRFFLTHGHRYALHNGCDTLIAAARNNYAAAALYGHTHIPCCAQAGGVLLINPGSTGRPRSRIGATFAVLELPALGSTRNSFNVRFWGIGPGGKIREVRVS